MPLTHFNKGNEPSPNWKETFFWILKRDVVTSSFSCPSVNVNSVFPLFFLSFCAPFGFISLPIYPPPFLCLLYYCIVLSPSPLPIILPHIDLHSPSCSSCLVLHRCPRNLTIPHRTSYFCLILRLGLFIYLFVCALAFISVPVSLVFYVASFYGRTLIILTFSTSNHSSS